MTSVVVLAEQLRRPVPGGIGTYARGLLMGLQAIDAAGVRVWASRPAGPADPLRQYGFPVVDSAVPAGAFGRLAELGLLRPPTGTGVVHSVSSLTLRPGRAALTAMVHDLAWRRVPEATTPRGRAWHETALRRVAARCARVVAPSEATAADLLEAGLPPERVVVIPEGVDHLCPVQDETRRAAAALLSSLALDGRPFLLSVSTLEPRKNLPRLLEAYRLLAARHGDAPALLVAGPAGWGPQLRPAEGVVLAGHVSDLALTGLYAAAVAVCYVPLVEGFGLPAAEAMSLGAPVVASPAVPSASGAAILADPRDVESIAAALATAVYDERARAVASAAGLELAAGFRWDRAAAEHLRIWEDVAADG